jgi:AcrR family transcriptional regulator
MSEQKSSKKERILNIAEEEFSLHGFDGVTIRQISNRANVDVALASYHFGNKLDLFHAVFNRRAIMLNQAREEFIKADLDKNSNKKQTLEGIIEDFLRPLKLVQQDGDPNWKNYLALLAYVMTSAKWSNELMPNVYNKRVIEFIDLLKGIFPNSTDEDLHWCYQHFSGALALTLAQTGRIDHLSSGKCISSDIEAAYKRLVPFVAAGFRNVCK